MMDIEYLTSEMVPENPLRKNSIVHVCCKDKAGRLFLVEIYHHYCLIHVEGAKKVIDGLQLIFILRIFVFQS